MSTTSTPTTADELNLSTIFFKLRTRWYYFAASLVLFLAIAYFVAQLLPVRYGFKSTLMLADRATGSRHAQDLLTMEAKDRETKVEDEIGILTSAGVVSQTLRGLDFGVSYHVVPDIWVNALRPLKTQEVYGAESPITVKVDTTAPQVTGVRFFVDSRPDGTLHVKAEGKRVAVVQFTTGHMLNTVEDFAFERTVAPGQAVQSPYCNFTIESTIPGVAPQLTGKAFYFVLHDIQGLTEEYQQKLTIKPIERLSRVLSITTQGAVPAKEIRFLNALMNIYIVNDLTEKNRDGHKAVAFIDSQLGKVGDSLRRSQAAVATFRGQRGLIDAGQQTNADLQMRGQLENERARAQNARMAYQNVLNLLRASPDGDAVSSATGLGVEDPVLNSQIIELAQLNSQKAGLAVGASENNPVLQVLNNKIKDRRAALLRNLTNLIVSADATLRSYDQRLGAVRSSISQLPENERQLALLRNQADVNDKNYTFLLQKKTEAAVTLATNSSDKKVVDQAAMQSADPLPPHPQQLYLISLVLALVLPAGLIMLMERANQTVQSVDQIKSVTSVPFLGLIADAGKAIKLVRHELPKSAVTESFRTVRINLQYVSGGAQQKVIGFTSAVSGEGKTFCCTNLTAELAISGKRTVLIETDLRKPTMSDYFGFQARRPGLSSYLKGDITLAEAMQQSEHVPNLDILTAGLIPEDAVSLLESPRFHDMIEQFKREYDYVMLDAPPVGLVSEYHILRQYIDVSVFVVRHRYTQRTSLQHLQELVDSSHPTAPAGQVYVLLNNVNFHDTYEYHYKSQAAYYSV
ncbi:GumC family protein [Hymenobacter psychrotolerans]|uniref:non-specific protein-tyrosine kinase n=1 Tax=Hymenobacter psychrotolerans DSM 18569 TaxID=1121959 RepID=A0A1M6W5M9_9BACT|nr:polysaccharide biosynthesis tyrosine autokinase [Hymenobacter psychrotolerans]SHK89070.1 capsular exopolysaccharide family [Hymenobacter psychrotolerans DSM 18569]